METHVKVVAILYLVFSILGVVLALCFLLFFGGIATLIGTHVHDPGARVAMPILGMVGAFLFVLLLLVSVPGILAGWGLLEYKEWARILAIVLSVLQLFSFPFGTALGVYALWTLLNEQTIPLFQRGRAQT